MTRDDLKSFVQTRNAEQKTKKMKRMDIVKDLHYIVKALGMAIDFVSGE